MLNDNMCCGVEKDNLMGRTGPDAYDDAPAKPHSRVFDFTGRPMRGFVYVEGQGLSEDSTLRDWVNSAVTFHVALRPAGKASCRPLPVLSGGAAASPGPLQTPPVPHQSNRAHV